MNLSRFKSFLERTGKRLKRNAGSEPNRVVVYCSILGGYDDLPTFSDIDPDIARVCFTDTPEALTAVHGWKIVPIQSAFVDAKLMIGYLKSSPHLLFGYDTTTVWVDGNMKDLRISKAIVAELLTHAPVAAPPHLLRYAVKDEIAIVVENGLESKAAADRVCELFESSGFPPERPLSAGLMKVCDNSHEGVRAANECWQQLICSGIRRDQLTFDYALWTQGLKAARIDVDWRVPNALFNVAPHRDAAGRPAPDISTDSATATRLNMPDLPSGYPPGVRWVFETKTEREGSLHRQLNEIVAAIVPAATLDGNYCHMHAAIVQRDTPSDPRRSWKREYLRQSVRGSRRALELGFNAGHSAVLLLEAEPKLRLTSIDIGTHAYVRPCGEKLAAAYGKRFELITEDSRDAIKGIDLARFDFVHINGGHGEDVFTTQLDWFCANADPGARVVVDDCYVSYIRAALDRNVELGLLATVNTDLPSSGENELFVRT